MYLLYKSVQNELFGPTYPEHGMWDQIVNFVHICLINAFFPKYEKNVNKKIITTYTNINTYY